MPKEKIEFVLKYHDQNGNIHHVGKYKDEDIVIERCDNYSLNYPERDYFYESAYVQNW